ncbi:uncharacterized protein LOC122505898 [Leptopilina heterotoma]|uniref:uncharacterized protein LOC122505898 n=1 Tax=Leptopilina heterotoma TaxID=63436 RepID=UPI001CA7DC34|nr:uncharacterized protein LOC122505898 [Leptopilina heterotoma]
MSWNSSRASGESDFARLTEVLSGIVQLGSRKANKYINEKILPEFDPASRDLSASEWLDKINMFGSMYDWDEAQKLYMGILKLRGNAKAWFDGLKTPLVSWEVFAISVVRQFPGEENFGKLFELAASHKTSSGQDLQTYCFEKVKRINKLKVDIPENKVVELVTFGIVDENIRMNVMASRNKTIAELNQCLSMIPVSKKQELKSHIYSRDSSDRKRSSNRDGNKQPTCFNCQKPGHMKKNCPEATRKGEKRSGTDVNNETAGSSGNKPKCTFCGVIGHVESTCFKKKNSEEREKKKKGMTNRPFGRV